MNKIHCLLIYFSIMGIFSCNSDDYYSGTASLNVNDKVIQFKSRTIKDDHGFSLFLDGQTQNTGSYIHSIRIYNIPIEEGKFSIFNEPASSGITTGTYSIADQDVTVELFATDKNDPIEDFIDILELRGKNVEGTLNISFKNFTNYQEQSSDSIIIHSGTFESRIKN